MSLCRERCDEIEVFRFVLLDLSHKVFHLLLVFLAACSQIEGYGGHGNDLNVVIDVITLLLIRDRIYVQIA